MFLAFLVANALISEVSRRSAHPLRIEIGRAAAGAIIAPAAYVLADAPFSHWWPGFMIMCLGGNIILGLLTGSPRLGRVLVLYYVALLTLAEWLGTPSMNWYAFALNAGAVAMVGLLFAEIVSLLGMALAGEREQRRQLALEKARSETLLQKEAEATLRASEAHFRSLIENASDAVAITEPSGVITYIGPSITRMLGYLPEELVGRHFAPIVYPDDRAAAAGALARAAENPGQAIASDIRILHQDGSWHTLETVSKRLPNGNVVSNLRDVSKRRAAEERLRESETLYRSLIEKKTPPMAWRSSMRMAASATSTRPTSASGAGQLTS